MVPLRVEQYVVGSVSTNCYFAINDDTKEVLIIDPGASAKKLAEKVREGGLKPTAILLTHGHFDHVLGPCRCSRRIGRTFGCKNLCL